MRPAILGVDPARGGPRGDDLAVAVLRRRRVESVYVGPPGDEMRLAEWIVTEARRQLATTVVVESAGLGHGVYARTRDLLVGTPIRVQSFVGARKARYDETAANQKAEVCLRLRTMLLENRIGLPAGPEFDRLADELMRLRMVTTPDGRVRITDPPKSPDFADALITALSALVYGTHAGIVSTDVDWI